MKPQEALSILYAEDDPDDRLLAAMAHKDSASANPLVFVDDGEEALEYLLHTGRHIGRGALPRPGVVILDLNMPGIGGQETLRVIRADPLLRRIPVVILTTSSAETDIVASYDAGANSYIVKPSAFGGLVHIFTSLSAYWFDVSTLAKEVIR